MIRLPNDFVTPEAFVMLARSLTDSANYHSVSGGGGAGTNCASRDPHTDLSWFSLLAQTAMPSGTKLALVSCGAAWLPMMSRPDALGRLEGLSNFYTPLYGLVNGHAVDDAALEQLFKTWRHIRGLSELRFAPMDPQGKDFQCLSSCLMKAGWWVSDYYCFGNWYHLVGHGGGQAYLAGRPSRVRNTIARAERRLAKVGKFNIDVIDRPSVSINDSINAFIDVYGKSWKQPEPFPNFIPTLCRMAADHGYLRLGILRLNREPIAVQLWLVAFGTAYIVKLAYDPEYAHYSPGSVLTAAMFRRAIDEDRVSCIDYLIGDDAYKVDWMSQRRERRGLVAFNPRKLRGVLGGARHFVGVYWRS
jgi:hypothetical protein